VTLLRSYLYHSKIYCEKFKVILSCSFFNHCIILVYFLHDIIHEFGYTTSHSYYFLRKVSGLCNCLRSKTLKRRQATCWPLDFTIQSLPPHLRGKFGLGTFLVSILSQKLGDKIPIKPYCRGVEYFIFRDCFVEELVLLLSHRSE
jgi:hypothetical protein